MNINDWQTMSRAAKKRLLTQAGHSTNYAYRAYNFLPNHVRNDIEYTVRLNEKCSACNGTGKVILANSWHDELESCMNCSGTGKTKEQQNVSK